MQTISLELNQVPASLRGSYVGRKFRAIVTESVTIPASAGLWDGGSRDTYTLVNMETGADMSASDNVSAPWDERSNRMIKLKPGFVVIEHSISRGKDLGLTFYVHPDNAAKLLPAPSAALSAHEALVIEATCSLKSSYGGKDRFEMMRDQSYGIEFPTRDEWNAAKITLIEKGLLNKAGAITVAGKNARNQK